MNIYTRQNGTRVWECDEYLRREVICSKTRFGHIVQEQEMDVLSGVYHEVGEGGFFVDEDDAVLYGFGRAMELALYLEEQRTPPLIHIPAWCQ